MKSLILYFTIFAFSFQYTYAQRVDSSKFNQTINEYLLATSRNKHKIEKRIIKLNPDFDYVFNLIRQGKHFKKNVKTGFYEYNFRNERGIEHHNLVFIPLKYNPEKKYQVRVFLHGGVSTLDLMQVNNSVNRLDTNWNSVNSICLFPASWILSPWWNYSQYENISNLLSYIKENYNVDENDIYLNGVSDGATGIFYLSNFYQTPFSCYLPFIGNMYMLTILTDKQFYLKNYQGQSYFIVNGKKDEIFDIRYVTPAITELEKTAKDVKFFIVDSSGHNLRWYPVLKDSIRSFINSHKRNPYPDFISYATEKPDTFCRKFWIKIDRIGKTQDDRIEDINRIIINQKSILMFPRRKPFGQIEVNKVGNTVYVKASNVKNYTILISPDHFDLTKTIEVYTNNILSFKGMLVKDLNVLLNYNIEDNDRTMLFSNELKVVVGKKLKE